MLAQGTGRWPACRSRRAADPACGHRPAGARLGLGDAWAGHMGHADDRADAWWEVGRVAQQHRLQCSQSAGDAAAPAVGRSCLLSPTAHFMPSSRPQPTLSRVAKLRSGVTKMGGVPSAAIGRGLDADALKRTQADALSKIRQLESSLQTERAHAAGTRELRTRVPRRCGGGCSCLAVLRPPLCRSTRSSREWSTHSAPWRMEAANTGAPVRRAVRGMRTRRRQ